MYCKQKESFLTVFEGQHLQVRERTWHKPRTLHELNKHSSASQAISQPKLWYPTLPIEHFAKCIS